MADVKWIKIVTDIFDDEKILLIESLPEADSIIVIWFKLLCLAGKQNNSGVFTLNGKIPYTDKMLSTIFRRKESTLQLALNTFMQFGMIEIIDDVITIPNWGKHQNLDQIQAKSEYMKGYMQKYRIKQQAIADCKTNSKANSKANVSQAEGDIDIDIDIDIDKERDKGFKEIGKKTIKKIPTLEEVKEYVKSRGNKIDADYFYSLYNEMKWRDKDGTPVLSWKGKIITWEHNQRTPVNREKAILGAATSEFDMDEYLKMTKQVGE